jgi:hypothetical protein
MKLHTIETPAVPCARTKLIASHFRSNCQRLLNRRFRTVFLSSLSCNDFCALPSSNNGECLPHKPGPLFFTRFIVEGWAVFSFFSRFLLYFINPFQAYPAMGFDFSHTKYKGESSALHRRSWTSACFGTPLAISLPSVSQNLRCLNNRDCLKDQLRNRLML